MPSPYPSTSNPQYSHDSRHYQPQKFIWIHLVKIKHVNKNKVSNAWHIILGIESISLQNNHKNDDVDAFTHPFVRIVFMLEEPSEDMWAAWATSNCGADYESEVSINEVCVT